MRLVPIESVRPNTVLGKTIYDIDGRLLLRAGMVLRENTIDKIIEMNILSIYIVDKYSNDEIEDIIKQEIRQKAIITIKEAFSNIHRLINNGDPFRNSERDYTWQEESYFYNIGEMAENIIDNVLEKKDIVLALVDIRSMNNYIYSHCVNVAVISLTIGIALKFSKKKLEALCIGALIHDIGKIMIPKCAINKETDFLESELKLLSTHSRMGYQYLSGTYNVNSLSKLIVLQHHERPDGMGYPDGLKDKNIIDLSKIVSIADAYDNLSTDVPGKRAMFPSDALEYLMANAGTLFDYDLISIFCRIVIPFPKGTIVKLNTEEIAIVEETIPNFPLRPIVRIIKGPMESRIDSSISLLKELHIVITEIEYDI